MTQTNRGYLDLSDVAARVGVTYNSARTYHGRAEINRRSGETKPADMPPPDRKFGRSPVWTPKTIDEWIKRRRRYVRKIEKVGEVAGSDSEAALGVGGS